MQRGLFFFLKLLRSSVLICSLCNPSRSYLYLLIFRRSLKPPICTLFDIDRVARRRTSFQELTRIGRICTQDHRSFPVHCIHYKKVSILNHQAFKLLGSPPYAVALHFNSHKLEPEHHSSLPSLIVSSISWEPDSHKATLNAAAMQNIHRTSAVGFLKHLTSDILCKAVSQSSRVLFLLLSPLLHGAVSARTASTQTRDPTELCAAPNQGSACCQVCQVTPNRILLAKECYKSPCQANGRSF